MDIFEQQETSKSPPGVKDKLNEWYNWLVNHHIPEPIEERASRSFKATKDNMGLYKRFEGKEPEEETEEEQNEEPEEE